MAKTKSKAKEGRQSRSRNTTPSSSISAAPPAVNTSQTAFLGLNISNLQIPTNISYDSILDRHGGGGSSGIPDPNNLETLNNDLKTLLQLAKSRYQENREAMNRLKDKRSQISEEEREREREREQARLQAEEDKRNAKKDDEEVDDRKSKSKRKKDRSVAREERPLNHGAHAPARQDGLDLPLDASPSDASKPIGSPPPKHDPSRASTSPLSDASPMQSPSAVPGLAEPSAREPSSDSDSSSDGHQPPPAVARPQYQTFGENPLTFDDPTIYEVREVTEDMTDEEKREIYCVSTFPPSDLRDLIAGTPPNKDFSNAVKPNNQVQPHTFTAYLDTYLRPLKEEDIGFLNERGDRVTPFVMPPRGKRHFTEVWADEDGSIAPLIPSHAKMPANQGRGSLDNMDDDVAQTDQVSAGPIASRLLAAMRFEHRPGPDDKPQPNGSAGAGDVAMTNGDLPNGTSDPPPRENAKPLPPATALPENARSTEKLPSLTHVQVDDRIKAELRHIGFLSADDEPDFESHLDDEVAERLRWLQERLRSVSILNGARKRRVLELAEEQLAYQEYSTILEDLDTQVQQAYIKRARTTSKSKKNAKRPGGAHAGPGGSSAAGAVGKPGIGDVARQLMNRRARWEEKIGPVFRDDVRRVPTEDEGIFMEKQLEPYVRLERDMFDEEGE